MGCSRGEETKSIQSKVAGAPWRIESALPVPAVNAIGRIADVKGRRSEGHRFVLGVQFRSREREVRSTIRPADEPATRLRATAFYFIGPGSWPRLLRVFLFGRHATEDDGDGAASFSDKEVKSDSPAMTPVGPISGVPARNGVKFAQAHRIQTLSLF